MDLEATWQEHKRFIVSVGVGAVAFGLLSGGVAAIEQTAGRLATKNAREQADLLSSVQGLKGQEASEKGKKQALEEKAAPAILAAITWTIDKGYLLSAEEAKNPSITYLARTAKAADEIGRRADKAGATIPRKGDRVPELNLDEQSLEGVRAHEATARVDVTRRILLAALDAGILKITGVRQSEATYTPLEGGSGFLRRIGVGLVAEGGVQELAKLLAAFQVDGSFLELGACRVTRAKDSRPDEGRLDLDLELGALTVEKEAPEDAAKSGTGEPGRAPPRRRRRD